MSGESGAKAEVFREGLVEKFRTIRSLAIGHLKSDWFSNQEGEFDSASGIARTYLAAKKAFENFTKEEALLEGTSMPTYRASDIPETNSVIGVVISNCAAAVAFLTKGEEVVSEEVRNKLDALLKEISEVQNLSPNLHAHLIESVKEHEATHYLASSVLAAKSIDYILKKLPGDNEVDRANYLVEKGLLERELKDGWVLTWKKARNYYVHDLSAIPASAESLSLVTAACQLGLAYTKANLS